MEVSAVSGDAANRLGALGSEVKREDFMKLLITQLKTQDPLDPIKNEDFMAQLAQFSTLESMKGVESKIVDQSHILSASLMGKNVRASVGGMEVSGIVESVRFDGSVPMLSVDGINVGLPDVIEVRA